MIAERSVVTFRSQAFNLSVGRTYFMNAENYGDDLACWVAEQLEKRGIKILKRKNFPGQEDFGWFFDCEVDDETFCIVVSHWYDGSDLEWVLSVERKQGLVKSLIQNRHRNISRKLLIALHDALSTSEKIRQIRWHRYEDFSKGILSEANSSPV